MEPHSSEESPNTSPSSRFSPKTKRLAVIIGVAVVVAIGLYVLGLSQGSSRVEEVEVQLQEARQQVQQIRSQAQRAQNRSQMYQSLALIYQTALDLEDRNFGTANRHLQQAASTLANVQLPNTSSQQLDRLQKTLSATNLEVAVNLENQRQQVRMLADSLQGLIPRRGTLPAVQTPEN